jgi:hypothetical protein
VCIEEFPLVQGERERYGDLLEVVLVDVDERDAGLDGFVGSFVMPKAGKILRNLELDWPNTIIDGGLGATQRLFNRGGYSVILVDPHGIVRGADLFRERLKAAVDAVMKEWAKERLRAGAEKPAAR